MTPEEQTGEILKVRAEVRQEARQEAKHALRRSAYLILVMVATVIMAAASSIIVTVVLTERSERKLCAVVVDADNGYRQSPPTTPAGQKQASNMARLRSELGCKPYVSGRTR